MLPRKRIVPWNKQSERIVSSISLERLDSLEFTCYDQFYNPDREQEKYTREAHERSFDHNDSQHILDLDVWTFARACASASAFWCARRINTCVCRHTCGFASDYSKIVKIISAYSFVSLSTGVSRGTELFWPRFSPHGILILNKETMKRSGINLSRLRALSRRNCHVRLASIRFPHFEDRDSAGIRDCDPRLGSSSSDIISTVRACDHPYDIRA